MIKYDLQSLNEQQLEALYCNDGAVLVTAGAGSGKTKLLTNKIAYLVKEKGILPSQILAITFTNKAANEMKDRLFKMLGSTDDMWISTFHAMCCKMLRRDINLLGYSKYFTIYTDTETDKLIDLIVKDKNFGDDAKDIKKQIKFHISNCKNSNLSIQQYEQQILDNSNCEKIIDVFTEYQEQLKKNNAVDFDDLLVLTYKLLKEHPQILEHYTHKFKYILVDEFQDTNIVQYDLVKMLSSYYKNVFVVGDEDQCIYSWRGASYENISRFVKELNAKTFKLELNYRSTPNILSIANKVIKNNKARIDKTLQAYKEKGLEPEFYQSYDEEAEAQYVVGKIKSLLKQGYKYRDFAILLRVSAISLAFEQALLTYNIPYTFYGGFKFFERAEIKNILAYLRLFVNPADDVSLIRIINFPKRGIGEGTIEKIRKKAAELGRPMLETLLCEDLSLTTAVKEKVKIFANDYKQLLADYETMPLTEFVQSVIDRFDIKSAFDPLNKEEYEKLLNFDTFVENVRTFEHNNAGCSLSDYLESVTLSSDIDNMSSNANDVILATVHSVKGLEFKVVFVVGAEEKIFPVSRAYDDPKDMEEERRLMYVAITRAEERLFLTCAKTRYLYGRRDTVRVSRFLKEAGVVSILSPDRAIEQGSYNAQGSYNLHNGHNSNDTNSHFAGGYSGSVNDYISQYKNNVMQQSNYSQKQDFESLPECDYKVGDKVEHPKYQIGQIIAIGDGGKTADIKFEGFGVKTLILSLAPITKVED